MHLEPLAPGNPCARTDGASRWVAPAALLALASLPGLQACASLEPAPAPELVSEGRTPQEQTAQEQTPQPSASSDPLTPPSSEAPAARAQAESGAPREDSSDRPEAGVGATPAPLGPFLDAWHAAASVADEEGYLGRIAEDGVYLGTDATERWDKAAFSAYVRPYFAQGRGWTYRPSNRHVAVEGNLAWFDELLTNQGYGQLRGTGVARWRDGRWELLQYDLHFTVPNDSAREVVEVLSRAAGGAQD